MNGILNGIRNTSGKEQSALQKILRLLLVLLSGLLFGFLAKLTDQISGLEDIGTYFGLWILVVTVLAAWSRSAWAAALHTLVFLLAVVLAYYLYSMGLFGSFYGSYFWRWSLIALLCLFGGFVVWYSRGAGWIAALCAALPIGALIAEGLGFLYVLPLHLVQFCFDLAAAVLLYVILPRGKGQHLRVLPFIVLFVIMSRFIRLPYF